MAITVRPIQARDSDAWRSLFQDYAHFYKTQFSETVLDGVWRWLTSDDHPEHGFVAEIDGTVVGFAHLQQQVDTFRAGPGWFLDDLYVHPDHRGKGVARKLIDHLATYARERGGGDLRWITAEDNLTAQGLYDTLATKTTWVMYEKDTENTS